MRWMLLVSVAGILVLGGFNQEINPAVGDLAPEIAMTNPQGDTLKLTDLRGKLVLIDFWASWCRPCRIENHHIRQSYLKYKDHKFQTGNSFTVLSISLDTDSLRWTKAIRNDKLYWDYHVSDFKKWKGTTVKRYNFSSLPHNLLVDSAGTIIAKGLFGEDLNERLSELSLD